MNLHKQILTQNDCYNAGRKITPTGIVVHSTGANNPNLRRYVQPDDGILGMNGGGNDWNHPNIQKCVHAMIGLTQDGTLATYQTLPWNHRCWGCGSGKNGSFNNSHIQFEILEDGLADGAYFTAAYNEAVALCVYLCKEYGISPGNIVCHSEAHDMGFASGHADVMHWFPIHGKNMDMFRADVMAGLEDDNMTGEEIYAKLNEYLKELPAPAWAQGELQEAVALGITDGTRPMQMIPRYQAAIMAARAAKK